VSDHPAGGLEVHPHDLSKWGSATVCGYDGCWLAPFIAVGGMPLCDDHAVRAHALAIEEAMQRGYWRVDGRIMV
jgi:hypothetical protein